MFGHNHKKASSFIVGLALFSMFFGSGNLIYPLYVGQLAEDNFLWGILGFVATAVFLPFLGVVTMVLFRGSYDTLFHILGKRGGTLLAFILLTVWIPLGSGPRCAVLAYASLTSYLPMPPLAVFSLVYTIIVAVVVMRRSGLIDLLGYVLTPALLGCLALIVFAGVSQPQGLGVSELTNTESFLTGLVEGYNTMDLIAALFFSASVIELLRTSEGDEKPALTKTFRACIVGTSLLGVVYLGLIALAAVHAPALEGIPKQRLLAEVSKLVLGPQLGIVAAVAVVLACFTTSVALLVVYADYLKQHNWTRYPLATTAIVTFLMSLTDLEGITFVTSPILKVFYPTLIVLILIGLIKVRKQCKIGF